MQNDDIISEQHDIDEINTQAALMDENELRKMYAAEQIATMRNDPKRLREAKVAAQRRAALDTTGGRVRFMGVGGGWHGLGVNVSKAQNGEQAHRLSGQDWIVEKWPSYASDPVTGTVVQAKGEYHLVRTDSKAILSRKTVSDKYQVFQNQQLFEFLDAVVGEKLAMYEMAGSVQGGRRVWVQARIPTELRAKGDDVIYPYALFTNVHDGEHLAKVLPSSVRAECNNTLNLALSRGDERVLHIRHIGDLAQRIGDARTKLGVIVRRMDRFQDEIDALAARSLSSTEVSDYLEHLFPTKRVTKLKIPGDGAAALDDILASAESRRALAQELIANHQALTERQSKRNQQILDLVLANFAGDVAEGTAWGAYNAVSQWADHQMSVRQGAEGRFESAFFGRGDQVKQEAYQAALALAT